MMSDPFDLEQLQSDIYTRYELRSRKINRVAIAVIVGAFLMVVVALACGEQHRRNVCDKPEYKDTNTCAGYTHPSQR